MTNLREWQEFKDVAARRLPNRVYATLNPKGEFVINLATFELMGEPETVLLPFDKRDDIIGLRPSTIATPNAIMVRTRHSRYNRVIRSIPFLKKHDIRLDRTVQFPAAVIDREGILLLDLRTRVAAGHMPWKPKRRM